MFDLNWIKRYLRHYNNLITPSSVKFVSKHQIVQNLSYAELEKQNDEEAKHLAEVCMYFRLKIYREPDIIKVHSHTCEFLI